MLIGELAGRAGATVKALRYYEEQGLLEPRRAPNGYREYDESAVARVRNIRLLLSVGLTGADVRAFLPCLDQEVSDTGLICHASAQVIARRLADVEERMGALDVIRRRLTEVLVRAEKGRSED
ncbi:MerR family transcriptional regulator [Sphaerisporangium fuscum]|uniref:MerR family transcriptional regulator n=1 Tax=Sphaerisporangium fuscum TaxID=2835868 RepID=UPI001BDC5FF0|nr:MerR family transcriptional regulator [Sphaerisporangium fuscum]